MTEAISFSKVNPEDSWDYRLLETKTGLWSF
jgi:hypothetical protein